MQKRVFCGTLREEHIGQTVLLKGWVNKRRDLGALIFVDLRDRSGMVQIVFDPDKSVEALQTAEMIRNEYVVEVVGDVIQRDPETVNPAIETGTVEVRVLKIQVLNKAKTPPFAIYEDKDINEDVRLKYRYLDLRRPAMQETLMLRSKLLQTMRNFLDAEMFIEVETPILTKSTPEGARDYLVPSRVHEGQFYALPQSPQIFKQLLMVSGLERYYQVARCFRDEDLRADRQPEFTQLDIETSFLSMDEIIDIMERLMQKICKDVKGIDIQIPFPRLTYQEAMERFGSDKPDTRFAMELIDLTDFAAHCDFTVFQSAVKKGGRVKGLNMKGCAEKYPRKDLDHLTDFVKRYRAKGLAWIKVEADGLKSPITKFFTEKEQQELLELMDAKVGDILVFVADQAKIVFDSLGALRSKLGKDLGLIDESLFHFLWVVEWPLLEYDEEMKRYFAAHHPFTMPYVEDLDKLETAPEEIRAQAYDIVLNGYELGGGSLRIYQKDIQEKMFAMLGFTEEEARAQFGFLMDAFEYGTPPHGGIALGIDRLVMLMTGRTNLRDTIAFPKTASASCLLTDAPSSVTKAQLEELHIALDLIESSRNEGRN